MNFNKRVNGSWTDTPHYIMGTDTDTITTPADIYVNDTTATVGLKGQMEQIGTPTPQNPIQPSECGERTGNLFDISLPKTDYATNVYQWTLSGLTPNAQYTCSSNYVQSGTTASIWFGGTSSGANGVSANSPKTMTANSNGEIIMYINHSTNNAYDQIVNNTTWVMLNTGSTALPYEPYGIKIPISSASTTTPVYLGEVQTTRKIGKIELNGTENIIMPTTSSFQIFGVITWGAAECICSHYKSISFDAATRATETGCAVRETSSGEGDRFRICDLSYTDIDTFKSYLAAQYAAGTPVTVWYVLAEPTTGIVNEPLRKIGTYADEVSGITIPTIAGANTISVDTTLQPSEVTVNYKGWHPVADVHERENGAWT